MRLEFAMVFLPSRDLVPGPDFPSLIKAVDNAT